LKRAAAGLREKQHQQREQKQDQLQRKTRRKQQEATTAISQAIDVLWSHSQKIQSIKQWSSSAVRIHIGLLQKPEECNQEYTSSQICSFRYLS
jgi:hypothetical protein